MIEIVNITSLTVYRIVGQTHIPFLLSKLSEHSVSPSAVGDLLFSSEVVWQATYSDISLSICAYYNLRSLYVTSHRYGCHQGRPKSSHSIYVNSDKEKQYR